MLLICRWSPVASAIVAVAATACSPLLAIPAKGEALLVLTAIAMAATVATEFVAIRCRFPYATRTRIWIDSPFRLDALPPAQTWLLQCSMALLYKRGCNNDLDEVRTHTKSRQYVASACRVCQAREGRASQRGREARFY